FRDETRKNTDALYGILTRLTEITERHDTDIDSLKARVGRLEKRAG
ncbi:MAG: hypothetical protein HYU64_12270, partial [Armatimonadetes bacterium]|nr:hypothetical protein [Armatimonadota bacterium]